MEKNATAGNSPVPVIGEQVRYQSYLIKVQPFDKYVVDTISFLSQAFCGKGFV